MTRKRVDGYCVVSVKDGSTVHLRRDQYGSARKAWLDGVRFLDVVGLHGESGTIKLEGVDGIYDMAPENVMSVVEEGYANDADDSLAGGAV